MKSSPLILAALSLRLSKLQWWQAVATAMVLGTLGILARGAEPSSAPAPAPAATEPAAIEQPTAQHRGIEQRLASDVQFLADDAREGRGIGTKGIDAAADFIADQFTRAGLKTDLWNGGPFQKFKITTGEKLGSPNRMEFVGPPPAAGGVPERIELKLTGDFMPLAIGGSGTFNLPLVFVGYGITAKHEEYDDYASVDVKGKAVIVLRHEPQLNDPHSIFEGTSHSQYAPFGRKVSNAYEHGASAVIFCDDEADILNNEKQDEQAWHKAVDRLAELHAKFKALETPSDEEIRIYHEQVDQTADDIKRISALRPKAREHVMEFDKGGTESSGRDFPVLHCRRAIVAKIVKAVLGNDLAAIEKDIDRDLKPRSSDLAAWRAVGEANVVRQEVEVKNVGGVIEGEGPLADETLVIGAHYDHLGFGGHSSMAPGVHEIHNGADDNASGTAALIEIARELAARPHKLRRRVLLLAFTGEEMGLLGSARYVREPLYPLDKTIAMLNMDMVGRLQDRKLIVYGTGTAPEFEPLIERLGKEMNFKVTMQPSGFGPSDHSSFYAQRLPVMHFFTGSHKDYHRPSDDTDKLNIAGMREVAQLVEQAAVDVAESPQRPLYQETKSTASVGGGGDRPYFGSIPDFSQDQPGYALTGVTKDGPAERAGIRGGDIIVKLGESRIGNLEDFDSALRKFKGGDRVPVAIKRGKEELTFEVTLDPPRK